jgi:hypothetical protein
VHEHENVIPVLLQQGSVQGTAALQGTGQEPHDYSHQGSHLLSSEIGRKSAWEISAVFLRAKAARIRAQKIN